VKRKEGESSVHLHIMAVGTAQEDPFRQATKGGGNRGKRALAARGKGKEVKGADDRRAFREENALVKARGRGEEEGGR
jgi:hypothetical protein